MSSLRKAARASERGITLLEAMIALTVLLVGVMGMFQLQVYGLNATQGARAQTSATQLAVELASALGRLQPDHALLTGLPGATATTPPTDAFGSLLNGVPAGAHVWSDASPLPGVRLDTELERDPEDPTQPAFRRRWTVWELPPLPGKAVASKMIAVSVIFRERGIAKRREIVIYANSANRNAYVSNAQELR